MKRKIYLAAGWFNTVQAEELTKLEEICESRDWIDLASPRKIFVCPPNAPKETQDATFDGNLAWLTLLPEVVLRFAHLLNNLRVIWIGVMMKEVFYLNPTTRR